MNIGTRMLLAAALAVGSTIGAVALGQTPLRDLQAEVAPASTDDDRFASGSVTTESDTTAGLTHAFGSYPGLIDAERIHTADADVRDPESLDATVLSDAGEREDGVLRELLAAAEAGEMSWAAAERVSDDLGSYIRGERRADVI